MVTFLTIIISLAAGFTLGIIFKSKLVAAEKKAAEALKANSLKLINKL
jgi:hypothetical protein